MAENKFIEKLRGESTAQAVLEIQDKKSVTSFANMPAGTSNANTVYSDARNNATSVLKGATNWKINGATLTLSDVNGDGTDYTGSSQVSGVSDQQGNNLWLNAVYTVGADGMYLTKNTKWVLKLCGSNLIVNGGHNVEFTIMLSIGSQNLITKKFVLAEQANQFCKEMVIDFTESNATAIKLEQGDTITLWLLCDISNASARIYEGMSTLTLLQRRVDSDAVSSNTRNFDDLEETVDDLVEDIDKKVNIDGSSIMSAPLKFVAGSLRGGIGPSFGGVEFYTLNNDSPTYSLVALGRFTTSGFIPHVDNTYDIGSTARKWKDLYVARVIAGVLNNGGDIAVPTKAGTMALESDIGRTNCITEIPQDIKLELSNGTLTLKAGSKVYVPNGAGVFTEVTIANDISRSAFGSDTGANRYIFPVFSGGTITGLSWGTPTNVSSGTTPPTNGTFYNESTNYINNYSGGSVADQRAFPIGIMTVSSGTPTSIDQVFNGIGYISSHVFFLPGYSVLTPNGRNTDGTLANRKYTFTSCTVYTRNLTGNNVPLWVRYNGTITFSTGVGYDPITNQSGGDGGYAQVATATLTGGVISNFVPKQPFHAVDYNDSEYIANCAMPSDKYVDLTLPADNTAVTAPADGYYTLNKAGNTGERVGFQNSAINTFSYASANGQFLSVFCPVRKGDGVLVRYTASGTTAAFRFTYTNGAK